MSNASASGQYSDTLNDGPFIFDLPLDGGSKVYRTCLVSQLIATGFVVPYSTAASGPAVGVAQHDVDNTSGSDGDKRVRIETKRGYVFTNGTSGDAFSEASLIGSVVYATDDHTVADNSGNSAYRAVGFFLGMESDGKVRVFVDPVAATLADSLLGGNVSRVQVAGGTFASGTCTINTGITVTASTDAFVILSAVVTGSTNVGTPAHIKASNVAGAPGVGTVVLKILGNDGAVDADAAGAFRVLLVN
jgi:hypothetical protein